ncbi:putative sulfate transporter yvdB [Candidatus Filomicrobium marinum]|uniref:Putative sulfate transporter yvdB n=1 Tax=Candidatus Filomicrobium marinum TaxID=1608628 RepID=A0A0D6JGH8_9HYPH|nr:SulP family inorganic anion transporter [Candidatus Filomicrobium marinum]CFX50819.1 putative sulfate transporter yvdB [Candidatus Filomicrobium marinum]CPR20190.1 putative sulfate transporter yvdB [Candidatus Filomicrobium marinum]
MGSDRGPSLDPRPGADLQKSVRPPEPTFAELFTPKLITVLREGYHLADLRNDAIAGLTVAIVALPLSMAIAIACGLDPAKGLYTAIIGGFIISVFGGSRFQIGGPAGAFIVLIATVVERHGYDGLVLATLMAGLLMMAIGFLRLGTYIKYIPYPVTIGFTAGIAVIILSSQLKEFLGLAVEKEPAALIPKLEVLVRALPTWNSAAAAVAVLSIALIWFVRRVRPTWPAFLIAVVAGSVLAYVFQLDIATIGTRFGGVPSTLPQPALPAFSFEKVRAVLPDAIAIALLGAIESLLSAVVADGMTGRRHRSNCELVAQGGANMASVVFSGMPATGTIARTATNVRSGAKGPLAGVFHSVYLLLFMAVAAPLASYIPLATLSAVLVVVAWNMAEREEFIALIKSSTGDRLILLATFLLTVFEDLTMAIGVGVVLGAFQFLHRMAESTRVDSEIPLVPEDVADDVGSTRTSYEPSQMGRDVIVYRVRGALFFGATTAVSSVLDRIGSTPKLFVLDLTEVPLVDSTAANALKRFASKLQAAGATVYLTGASKSVRRSLLRDGLRRPLVRYAKDVETALAYTQTENVELG